MKKLFFLLLLIVQIATGQQSPHGKIKMACEVCHSTDSWSMRKDTPFNHDSTGFTLLGRHKYVQCRSCHQKLVFAKRSFDCISCHSDIHRQELGTNCLRCHTMESWVVVDMKQKHQETRFPLLGKHALTPCDVCHTQSSTHRYAGTPLTCIACHKDEYEATNSPNHMTAGFTSNCNQCHKVNALSWSNGFDHNFTAFPLIGAHRAIVCSQCHINNLFNNLSTTCYDCHSSDYTRAQSPNHTSGNFDHLCQTCHSTTAWQPASFDHNATRFVLTGKHVPLQCQSCHLSGNYQLTYTDCYQCHQSDFLRPTNPNHVLGNFSHGCQLCHPTNGWQPATFDHNTTKFQLTGKHITVTCQSCHTSGNYQLTYTDCYQCHQPDFQKSTNPNHVTGNFNRDCTQCHATSGWTPATFDHNTTKFQLTGKHITVTCQSCHTSGNYQLTYTDCYKCHQTNYQQVTNPNHATQLFSHDCTPCHSTSVWTPNTMNHDAKYFKIYTGRHLNRWTKCSQCHITVGVLTAFSCTTGCHQTAHHQDKNCHSCHTKG